MMIKVTAVIPLGKDRKKELEQIIDCIESQTINPGETLIETGINPYINRNAGWKKAKGNVIWFLDSDIVPDKDALEWALETFKTNPTCAGVEGHIYGRIERVWSWGFMSGHMFYKKAILKKAGGFDERFTAWRGDTDLAWTIMDQGGEIIYCQQSRAHHPNFSSTEIDLKMEKLFRNKHPERYEKAKKNNYLHCFI